MMHVAVPLYTHPNFQVFHVRFKSTPATTWACKGDYPISLFFCTKGAQTSLTVNNRVLSPTFLSWKKTNFLYRGSNTALLSWHATAITEFIEIRLKAAYLSKLINSTPSEWPALFHLDSPVKQVFYGEQARPLQPENNQIVNNIIHASLKPTKYQELVFEALVMEAVAYACSQLQHQLTPGKLPESHTQIALQAQKHINANKGRKQFTIIGLAQQLGTNETTLKQAFKATFGKTLFRYFQERNMQGAKEALQAGQSITDVATKYGYMHIAHFSAAFKKEFGVPPSRIQ